MRYLFLILTLVSLTVSCKRRDEMRELRRREAQAFQSEEQVDEIRKAMPFLPLLLRVERGSIMRDFINQMNSWAITQGSEETWKPSPLLESIPQVLRTTDIADRLNRIEFAELESEYLAQCRLFNQVSRWVVERPYQDSLFSKWLKEQCSKLSEPDAFRLETAFKLFDWTVRNIAMEGSSKDIEALVRDATLPLSEQALGYKALPWHTLMYGRGDSIQRLRVFTQLLFQQEIPAVVLAFPVDAKESESDRLLWCVGVPIADDIYLFEMRFGLPLPLGDYPAAATLREARNDPNILRRAKLPGRFDYPVTHQDLSKAIALLDIEPFALSHAMLALEERLTGENRMQLAVDTSSIVEKIQAIDPKLSVELWQLPWLAQLYHRDLRGRIHDMSPSSIQYMAEFGAYLNESIVQEARLAHFAGQFESNIDTVGAPMKYMNIRIDDGTLGKLPYDTEIQRELQIVRRTNEKAEEFEFRIQQAQQFYRSAKLDSNAFLGMLQFDLGNFSAAIDWLDNRLLQMPGTERWTSHARYLLGRCCEAQGNITEALGWYKREGSPQEAGNRIRVRLLEKMDSR